MWKEQWREWSVVLLVASRVDGDCWDVDDVDVEEVMVHDAEEEDDDENDVHVDHDANNDEHPHEDDHDEPDIVPHHWENSTNWKSLKWIPSRVHYRVIPQLLLLLPLLLSWW